MVFIYARHRVKLSIFLLIFYTYFTRSEQVFSRIHASQPPTCVRRPEERERAVLIFIRARIRARVRVIKYAGILFPRARVYPLTHTLIQTKLERESRACQASTQSDPFESQMCASRSRSRCCVSSRTRARARG